MTYFFGFLTFFAGLPLPGTLRMASTADSAYMFVLPAWVLGSIPALIRRVLAASRSIWRISAISVMVNPFIHILSVIMKYILENVIISRHFLLTKNKWRDIVALSVGCRYTEGQV